MVSPHLRCKDHSKHLQIDWFAEDRRGGQAFDLRELTVCSFLV